MVPVAPSPGSCPEGVPFQASLQHVCLRLKHNPDVHCGGHPRTGSDRVEAGSGYRASRCGLLWDRRDGGHFLPAVLVHRAGWPRCVGHVDASISRLHHRCPVVCLWGDDLYRERHRWRFDDPGSLYVVVWGKSREKSQASGGLAMSREEEVIPEDETILMKPFSTTLAVLVRTDRAHESVLGDAVSERWTEEKL